MISWSKAPTFEPVEPGTYEATLTDLKFVPSLRNSGNPGLRFDFILTEPHVEGKRAFSSKTLDVKGLSFTKEWLIKFGANPADLEQDMSLAQLQSKIEEWRSMFVGQAVRIVLGTYHDKQTGELRQSVDTLLTSFELG